MASGYVGWPAVLNQLAGTSGLGEQAAANAFAGTTGLSTLAALNAKIGIPPGGGNYDAVMQDLGPVAWWKLADAANSTTAADSSGNGNTGTVEGTVTFGETGPVGDIATDTAALFDGSTGYIKCSWSSVFDLSSNFSIVTWVKSSTANETTLVDHANWYVTRLNDGIFYILDTAGNGARSSSTYFDGNWHMLVATMSSPANVGNISLYADGSKITPVTFGIWAPTLASDVQLLLGSDTSYFLAGTMAQVALFDKSLQPYDIATLYNAAMGGVTPLGINAVCNKIAGTQNMEALAALNILAGNGAY